jgi:hypothetical protein
MSRSTLRTSLPRPSAFSRSRERESNRASRRISPSRLSLESLEARISPVTDVSTNPLGGVWAVGSNWSLNAPPTSAQGAAVAPVSGVTVSHASGIDTVHSLTSDGSLVISGGSLGTSKGPT